MKIAEQAVQYYCMVTGNDWKDFYNNLDTALKEDKPDDGQWLIQRLVAELDNKGITVNEFKRNKDVIKGVFAEADRKLAGEFFTPEIWCKEGRKFFDKYIGDWKEYNVWDFCCGSGNLMRSAGHPKDKLFLSTLQEDDIILLNNTAEYKGATIFQLDFLKDLDYDMDNRDFLDNLPERLQEIILNDEPLILYANPPYKAGVARSTDVGAFMCESGMSKPAYDIYYHFMWRIAKLVEMYKLSNTYFCNFGPLTFFTGSSANVMFKQYEKCLEFIDGFCLSAAEFNSTSEMISWGIANTFWRARGGYDVEAEHKDIALEQRFKLEDGTVGAKVGRRIYEPPREKLSTWVLPKDVCYYTDAPLMTSHSNFKGSEAGVKVAPNSGKMAVNAMGTLMVGNTLARNSLKSAFLSMPSTMKSVSITEENFWRCVASYTYRNVVDKPWQVTKQELSAPNTKAEGYDTWLKNALVLFLFDFRAMMSSIRDVDWGGVQYSIRNKFFYITEEEVVANCTDEVILKDLRENPADNMFMLDRIEESKPYWCPEVCDLYNFCKGYTLETYNKRVDVGYKGNLECWDLGFQQLRVALFTDDNFSKFIDLLNKVRIYLKNGAVGLGFLKEVIL